MATAMEQLTGLGNLLTSANAIFGGGGQTVRQESSGGKTTTSNDITPEGLQRIIDQMMAGPGGVKDISGAARGAGLYNSTTEAQLRNDLAARVSGEAAARSATTTTTTSPTSTVQTTDQEGAGIAPLAGLIGMELIGTGVDKLWNSDLVKGGIDSIGNALGFGGGVQQVGSLASGGSLGLQMPAAFGGASSGLGLSLGGQGLSTLGGASGGLGLSLGSGIGGGLGGLSNLGSSIGSGLSAAGGSLGFGGSASSLGGLDAFSGLANSGELAGISGIGDIFAGSAGGALGGAGGGISAGLGALPLASFASPISSLLGGILGGKDAINPVSLGMSSLGSGLALAPAMGPLALAVGPVLSGLGSLFGDSVICTALVKRGLLDSVEYASGEAYLKTLHTWTIRGYYLWGMRVARKIDAGSPWAIAICLPWAHSRMKLISAQNKATGWGSYFKAALRNPLGAVTQYIGQPLCWLLGGLVTLSETISLGDNNGGH